MAVVLGFKCRGSSIKCLAMCVHMRRRIHVWFMYQVPLFL